MLTHLNAIELLKGMNISIKPELKPITGLRFLIAFWVFIFHIQIRWPIFHNLYLAEISNQGAIGMTFFFILSGYVLSYQYDLNLSMRSYFKARFARIYPVYILGAILTLPWLIARDLIPTSTSFSEILFLIIIDVLLLQAWFPPTFGRWNNGGSWSISVEAFFYLSFPALKRKLDSFTTKQIIFVLISTYSGLLLISAAVYLYGDSGMSIAYSMPIFRILEFLVGICTFKLFHARVFKVPLGLIFSALLGFFVFDLIFFGSKLPMYVTHDWIAVPFFASLLIYITNRISILSRILGSKSLNLLGKASYSFYSLQVVLILVSIKFKVLVQAKLGIISDNQTFALALFGVILSSSLFLYYFIEEPLRKKISSYL